MNIKLVSGLSLCRISGGGGSHSVLDEIGAQYDFPVSFVNNCDAFLHA